MAKFCSNCGNEINENADICLKCGVLIKKENNSNQVYNQVPKVPGKGLSISGMVLGIIAIIWAFFSLLSIGNIDSTLQYSYSYYDVSEIIGFAIGYTLFSFIPSLVGLPLSISGLKKQKSGLNVTGVVLNIIALSIAIIEIVYIMSYL